MRKCRLKVCRGRLPAKKDCTDSIQREGFCTFDCLNQHAETRKEIALERKRRHQEKLSREGKRQQKASDRGWQQKLTQDACNRLARALDVGKPCISCGERKPLEAGHFKSVGARVSLRYCLLNIHGQCRGCNQAGTRKRNRGKDPETVAEQYEARLRARIGHERVEWLKGPHGANHYSLEELRIIRKACNDEAARVEAGQPPSRNWRIIPQTPRPDGILE